MCNGVNCTWAISYGAVHSVTVLLERGERVLHLNRILKDIVIITRKRFLYLRPNSVSLEDLESAHGIMIISL
jgi:hypothetical protein